jgi:hypothetical protein
VHLRRNLIFAAGPLAFLVLAALPAGAAPSQISANAQPVYFATTLLLQKGTRRDRRCGSYRVTTATYVGTTITPEPRLQGELTYRARLVINNGGTHGVATGTFTIRDGRRVVRMRSTIRGVVSFQQVVNGQAMGNLFRPSALLSGNMTMDFNDNLTFAAVRFGMESGANTAVSYPRVPRC